MRIQYFTYTLFASGILILLSGCNKYLDEKSDKKLVVLNTLEDLQAVLDNSSKINFNGPGAAEVSADDYYVTTADWNSQTEDQRRMYLWEADRMFQVFPNDWSRLYDIVYIANNVLKEIQKTDKTPANASDWNNIKGQAFFARAKSFWHIAVIWCKAYDQNTAAGEFGIPLRLDPDFNVLSARSTLKETYDQIIADLKEAASLLPVTPVHPMRSSKPAVFALLARTYLSMGKYEEAGQYADSCLKLKNILLDFNASTVNANANFPFSTIQYANPEIIFEDRMSPPAIINNARAKVDSILYQSYNTNDLRKAVFFKANTGAAAGTYGFKGSYSGSATLFDGIATDEVYLMRAEAYAKAGNKDAALTDLNALMIKRWRTLNWTPITATDANDALGKIRAERRKELVMRGLRWMDIKRLNKEGAGIILKRTINTQLYGLSPNDLKYALPLPEDVITLSGMSQNPR